MFFKTEKDVPRPLLLILTRHESIFIVVAPKPGSGFPEGECVAMQDLLHFQDEADVPDDVFPL